MSVWCMWAPDKTELTQRANKAEDVGQRQRGRKRCLGRSCHRKHLGRPVYYSLKMYLLLTKTLGVNAGWCQLSVLYCIFLCARGSLYVWTKCHEYAVGCKPFVTVGCVLALGMNKMGLGTKAWRCDETSVPAFPILSARLLSGKSHIPQWSISKCTRP